LAVAAGAFFLLRGKGVTPLSTPQVPILPKGFQPALLADSGLIIGATGQTEPVGVGSTGIQTVLDPATGQVVAIDPQGAIATGGGLFTDASGAFRFGSGGFVGTTVAGTGIAGTEAPGGGTFGVGSTGGEIIPASFEDPLVLAASQTVDPIVNVTMPEEIVSSQPVTQLPGLVSEEPLVQTPLFSFGNLMFTPQ